MFRFFLLGLLGCMAFSGHAQAGLTATPVKFYYSLVPGENGTQSITVSNPTNVEVEVGVSFSDWNYDTLGRNQILDAGTLATTCTDWIQILPSSYFVLQPHERKKLDIVFSVPPDAKMDVPVHTALLFFTQLNPGNSKNTANGAAIKVTVRMGVKIYHSFYPNVIPEVEIMDFNTFENEETRTALYLVLKNEGKIWANGEVKWELFSNATGKKTKLDNTEFFTLPGDERRVEKELPEGLKPGDYVLTAIVNYGDMEVIKVAELSFSL